MELNASKEVDVKVEGEDDASESILQGRQA